MLFACRLASARCFTKSKPKIPPPLSSALALPQNLLPSTKTKAPLLQPSLTSAATRPSLKIFCKPSSRIAFPPATASKAAAASLSLRLSTAPQKLPTASPPSEERKSAAAVYLFAVSIPLRGEGENHFPRIVHKVLNFEKYQTLGKQKMSMT